MSFKGSGGLIGKGEILFDLFKPELLQRNEPTYLYAIYLYYAIYIILRIYNLFVTRILIATGTVSLGPTFGLRVEPESE